MGYADQRGMLKNALEAAGLAPNAAAQIASILANSRQDSLESSRARVDTTPESMRMVDKETRKSVLTNLEFRGDDPDFRPQLLQTTEEQRIPKPMPNVTERLAPQQTQAVHDVSGGTLAEASGEGDSVSVNVRSRVANPTAAGTPMAMLDKQANSIVGKVLQAVADSGFGNVRFEVNEGSGSVTLNLALENLEKVNVVTGIAYDPGLGIRLHHMPVAAWPAGSQKTSWIGMREIRVATEVVDDLVGPRTHTAYIPSFQSLPHVADHSGVPRNLGADIFFNLVRIGKFTGAWTRGTVKSVTQVWPEEGGDVDVENLIADVAETEDETENYVFFIVRTEDIVPEEDVRGESENPHPKIADPPPNPPLPLVKNYAIAIQPSTRCDAFSSLSGGVASSLTGYQADVPSALSYAVTADGATEPCLRWRSHTVDVITGAALGPDGLVFARKRLYVLGEGPAIDPVTIPVSDCPEPPPEPTPCTGDGDCPEGECCVDGTCGECPPLACLESSDCPEGETCVDGFCEPA